MPTPTEAGFYWIVTHYHRLPRPEVAEFIPSLGDDDCHRVLVCGGDLPTYWRTDAEPPVTFLSGPLAPPDSTFPNSIASE